MAPVGGRPVFIGRQQRPADVAADSDGGAVLKPAPPTSKVSPPKLRPVPPQKEERVRPDTSGSLDELVAHVVDKGSSVQVKVRKLIVQKQRHNGHSKSDTLRLFESHADIVDGTIDRPSFKHVMLERLRLSLDETELDMLYTVLGPDDEDRVQLSRLITVLHTKQRWDPRKYFPQKQAVDPVMLRHFRSSVPCLSGALHETRAAPPGAGRHVPSPEAREEFRSEVAVNLDHISSRKNEQREREQLAQTSEMALGASLSRHRLPNGTTDIICGASTSRQWPPRNTMLKSPRGTPKAQSAREGPVSAGQFLSTSSGDLVSVSAAPLGSPRREFSAQLLPSPGSPRSGFNGVPGVRVPPNHCYEQPLGAKMDPMWIPPKAGKGLNTTFSKGNGWNLQPSPKALYTKEFQATLASREQEHDSQAVSQTIGTLRRRKEHFSHGTRFFDPRTEYGCTVEINPKNGLIGRSFGDREGHRFVDELPKRNSWNPSIYPAPSLPGPHQGVFGYETKASPHPKDNPKVHWNTMVRFCRHLLPWLYDARSRIDQLNLCRSRLEHQIICLPRVRDRGVRRRV